MSRILEPARTPDRVGLRRTSLGHPHRCQPHWVLQPAGLAGAILSFFFAGFAHLLSFQLVSSNSYSFPSAENNGRVVNDGHTSNRNQTGHQNYRLLPLTWAQNSGPGFRTG